MAMANLFPQSQGIAWKSPCRWCFLDAPFIGAKPMQNTAHCTVTQKNRGGKECEGWRNGAEVSEERDMKSWGHRAGPSGSCWGRNPGTSQAWGNVVFQSDDPRVRKVSVWMFWQFFFVLFCSVHWTSDLGYTLSLFQKGLCFLVFSHYFPILQFGRPLRKPSAPLGKTAREGFLQCQVFLEAFLLCSFEELSFSSSSFRSMTCLTSRHV